MCIFCKIASKEIPSEFIYEDEKVIAIKDLNPITDDHTLVIPKQHAVNMLDIDPQLFSHVMVSAQQIANKHMKEHPDFKGYNIIINNNEAANQSIFHIHVHIVYRRHAADLNYFSKKD